MSSSTISQAVRKVSHSIKGAYSYIFDVDENRFLYQSEMNPILEREILKLNGEKGLGSLVDQSPDNFFSVNCQNTGRIFMIKRMAADLFFGLCVEKKPDLIEKAERLMLNRHV